MTRVTRSVEVFVRAPLQATFSYVADMKRHPEWNDGLRIEELTTGPIDVGKEYASRGKVAVQKDRPNIVRVSQYAPSQTFAFVARDPSFGEVEHEFKFRQRDEGVQIVRNMTLHLNPIVAFLFHVLVYPLVGQPSMHKSFAALKARLETSPIDRSASS